MILKWQEQANDIKEKVDLLWQECRNNAQVKEIFSIYQ